MKIGITIIAAIIAIPILIGGLAEALANALFGSNSTQPSQVALDDIPSDYLALYQQATAVCPGLDWSILGAIGKIETNHGRSALPGVADGTSNAAGARGPMQFLQSTFDSVIARHPLTPGGKNPPSPWDKHDAIYAAAYYLCDSGAPKDLRKAIFAYNHADWYVNQVLAQAQKYGQTMPGTGDCTKIQAPTAAVTTAITFACSQLGRPYQWGGDGPAAGDAGFDCSGLTMQAYHAAGITLPRTAQAQYNTGPLVPTGQPLLPGDLIFYGTPNHVHHVGLYLGAGKIVHASTFNEPVKISSYRWNGDDFLAASRPVVVSRV
ncbi:NlpC/P60 family protein [Actinocrispum wychmicini]|uniref:NlpC/P60 family protein n=1 Tax=Actinocrispum wychmicini TaxID=1213861 RepID=A0A4R2IVL3_9PSEU|nr:bifunctional lytic transglycosylase/C40 family peptidase [Actinocrispum wychmicini]TCO49673.1 NlpC/P60 family protein [Actinocrispum wychmicini]